MTIKKFYEWAMTNGLENYEFVERELGFCDNKIIDLPAMDIIGVDNENKKVYINNTQWEC